ncbi:MAG TPA: DUF5946 family protein [Acidimicrobiia bacterium]|nr:DUF5946 family protein [Acidimicrobiia bacterium]
MCDGCGLVGDGAGPTHPYMLSSPECWARYGELLATGAAGQLGVDAYAVQHPGVPERRAVQSVGAHLVSLCAALERDWPPGRAIPLIRTAVDLDPGWVWLDPQLPLGTITVADVVAVDDWHGRSALVRSWAEEMWEAHASHHELVRSWLDTVLTSESTDH